MLFLIQGYLRLSFDLFQTQITLNMIAHRVNANDFGIPRSERFLRVQSYLNLHFWVELWIICLTKHLFFY